MKKSVGNASKYSHISLKKSTGSCIITAVRLHCAQL
jgi:hypothetical protein